MATHHLAAAFELGFTTSGVTYLDDLLRLLCFAERTGHGERLITWFETSGEADRHAPVHAAFVAYVRGERMLNDVNPEVRQPAQRIYAWLASHRRDAKPAPASATRKRRGRPRGNK